MKDDGNRTVMLSKLTANQARLWLINNDPEQADFWKSIIKKQDLIAAVVENLLSFGLLPQGGNILITSNCNWFTRQYRFKLPRPPEEK